MSHTILSVEGRLKSALEVFGCSIRAFGEIVSIPSATMTATLNGQRSFTPGEVERVEDSLDAMRDFQARMNQEYGKPVVIDWSDKRIAEIVQIRRIEKLMYQDSGDPTHGQRAKDYGIPRIQI